MLEKVKMKRKTLRLLVGDNTNQGINIEIRNREISNYFFL